MTFADELARLLAVKPPVTVDPDYGPCTTLKDELEREEAIYRHLVVHAPAIERLVRLATTHLCADWQHFVDGENETECEMCTTLRELNGEKL